MTKDSYYYYRLSLMGKRQQLSNKFALKKHSKRVCTAEDRISELPDEILVHILSSLSVKEAADTSLLSKRWLPLWTYIYRLDFDATKPLNEVALNPKLQIKHMNKYIRWVNSTLQMQKVGRLDQLRVCFDLDKFAQYEIDSWLEFAISRKVQRLELDLLKGGEINRFSPHCYNFPALHFGLSDYAAQPRLNYVHKLPPLLRNFKFLKVEINGCPTHILDEILPIVSCVLTQLEVLKIHADDALEYLGKYKIPQLNMLKKFVLVMQAWGNKSYLDCTNVIEAAPQLMEFELNLLWIKPKRSKRECRKVVSCPLHHLKVLRLYGYYGRTSELELVRYILENAIVLEKIIVDPLELFDFHIMGAPKEDRYVRIARKYAKLQLQSEVPSHIELVIL